MGVAYRALDQRVQRRVALELLRSSSPPDPEARERFVVEARAAAALDHPNICTTYQVGDDERTLPFIAMTFYPGQTLQQVMQQRALPPALALNYVTRTWRCPSVRDCAPQCKAG